MEEDKLLKISELAKLCYVMTSTIRHYTDMGLLKIAGYTAGGHRLYSKKDCLERIKKIQAFSQRGLTLCEVKQELDGQSHVKKILIVDDDPDVVEFILELIKTRFPHFEVPTAMDGFSAAQLLYEFFPNLVILDIMLPGVNGFEICKKIRTDPKLSGTAVLAITGFETPEIQKKIESCGANDYLAKPMSVSVLCHKIEKLLGLAEVSKN
jgi:CheY-like chemotaxis protein